MEDSSLYGSFMKQRSSEKRRQHQSLTSISTLSSYDFDTVSSWGPHDLTNVSFGSPNTGYVHLNPSSSPGWNHKGNIDEGSREQSMQRRSLSSWIPDPDVSVVSYTLSDYEMESEDEKNLQETISYSKPWPNPNEESDHNNCDKYGDNGDYGYDDHAECLIDMEANAKAWAMAWELSTSNPSLPVTKDFGVGPLLRCDRLGDSCRSKRELNAAALKRKYYREFAEKHQAVVVSSHYEDNINTFTFPYASDYDDGASLIPLKLFDDAETELDVSYHNDLMDAYKSHERAEEKHVYHSLAIEKKSENPYLDFRDSMVEMVLEKQMHKSSELEELLQSFLSLNSLEYHELIVQAFSEVWEKVFGSTNTFHWKS
ncbi:hypothetical protein KP509_01G010900 [Ceratopteris richardii]|nr:hypothetical protein KP509_01G010900 [Ceratopteris richardii]